MQLTKDFFKGKNLKSFITDETKLNLSGMDLDETDVSENHDELCIDYYYGNYIDNNDCTIVSSDDLTFIFKNDKCVSVIYCYETEIMTIERSLLILSGHETIHMLWLDNFEYKEYNTR